MAKFVTKERFKSPIPEGRHILKVTDAKYDPDFGANYIQYKTEDGYYYKEYFNTIRKDGSENEVAVRLLDLTTKILLQNYSDGVEVEDRDLIGRFLVADVLVEEYNGKGQNRFRNKAESDGWEGAEDTGVDEDDIEEDEEDEEDPFA